MIKKYILVTMILALFSILIIYVLRSKPSHAGLEFANRIPLKIGLWEGKDFPVDYAALRILETSDVLYREYSQEGVGKLYLLIVFSADRRKTIHPPEVCYLGSGFEIVSKTPILFKTDERNFDAIRLYVNKDFQKEIIVYWYKIGSLYTGSYIKQQINIVLNLLSDKDSPGALMEVMMLMDENSEKAEDIIRSFLKDLIPLIDKYIP
ncbi:MAG: EpsI family protein [Chlamydiota bacterium]|nr:EpsI family protein [Chlamydiota bacterium]